MLFVTGCRKVQEEPVTTPWGTVLEDTTEFNEDFDLAEIQGAGELIVGTIGGPLTCYDYRGQKLGLQYMLCQLLASDLGVSLRIDLCRDSAEVAEKLQSGDIDIAAWPTPGSLTVNAEKPLLDQELKGWYTDSLLAEAKKAEAFRLSSRSVKRRVFSPMLDRQGGIISKYGQWFVQYARNIRWDWRLLAAQCYQESTFDPKATSWAGAKGLMQIMPGTANQLGLPEESIYSPQENIAAGAKLLGLLRRHFSDIPEYQRNNFILASYNGGSFHIRDAMKLTKKYGGNPNNWNEVSQYVLKLSDPTYYQDPIVSHGYMRGAETVDYVQRIQNRYAQYCGFAAPGSFANSGLPQRARHKHKYR